MTLLKEIQDLATDDKVKLPVVLRKCKILAVRLGHKPFGDWVDRELSGYKSVDEVPSYREIKTQSFGTLMNPLRQIDNAPIPPACIPEKCREFVTKEYLMAGVANYETHVADRKEDLKIPWPADLVASVSEDIYTNMTLMSAWKVLSVGTVVGMLDAIRNKVLNFALEIESEDPHAGEVKPGEEARIPQEKITQVFETNIYGTVHNIAAGNIGYSQQNVSVVKGDLGSLSKYLSSLGIDQADIQELNDIVKSEPDAPKKTLGHKVKQWITRVAGSTLMASQQIASTVITEALMQYYGLAVPVS